MAPSGFPAVRTTFQLAADERDTYSTAAEALTGDSFVDDVNIGADSIAEATELVRQLGALAKQGGFTLRKWASHEPSVLQSVSNSKETEFELNEGDEIGALGLIWYPRQDEFVITGKLPALERDITKRTVLSESSKLFDSLGLLASVIVVAKLIKRI